MGRFVVAVAVGAVLAGCTSDPEPIVTETPVPRVTPSETPSPSPSSSPSPSPTGEVTAEELHAEIGGQAHRTDLAGAMATAVYFFEARPYLFKDFDFSFWEALSLPECVFCESSLESARETASREATHEGGLSHVQEGSIEAAIDESTGDAFVRFVVEEEPTLITGPEGEVILDAPAATYNISMGLSLRDAAWRVVGVTVD